MKIIFSSRWSRLLSIEPPVAYLELCYATSINMPEEVYGPENVFDGDTATYWATMPGAAPDEGIYFSFEQPVTIQEIIVETVPGNGAMEKVEVIQLYINGIAGASYYPDRSIRYNGPVKSVFVRIERTESMYSADDGIRYSRDVPVGISEIRLFVRNDDNELVQLRIMPILEVEGEVQASSCLEPRVAYGSDFLFDSRPAFGWADGNEDASGEGESLTISFEEPQRIEKVRNGYHRSGTHFQHNERAALIAIGTDGEKPVEYALEDVMEPQVIELDFPLECTGLEMDFIEVYPGETYKDLVVSELRFFNGVEWFVIDTGESESRKREVLDWANNDEAGAFIDRQLYSHTPDPFYYDYQSIVVRSNGSFVIWKVNEHQESEERMYADGNWQVLDNNRIRIFGRLHRLATYEQEGYDPYAGSWSDQEERLDRMIIFSDTLNYAPGWLSSSRGLFEDFQF